MKKLSYLIVLTLILGLVLTGCLLSNVGQVPTTEQSGISYLTKAILSPNDLVGLWHFDGDVKDSSGDVNDGNVYGTTAYVDSPMGQALSFNGVGDYVEVDSDSSIMPAMLTIEAWIQPGKTGTRQSIVSKWDGFGDASYSLELTSTDKFLFYLHNGTTTQSITGTTIVTIGTWYHVVGTYDGSKASLYVNGNLEAGPTTLVPPMTDSSVPLRIGASAKKDPYPIYCAFKGLIDEVRIWKIALSSEQLDEVYDFEGFYPPVENLPTRNMVKAGRAIPVKFSLKGDQGLNIFEDGYPKSWIIGCGDGTDPVGEIEDTVNAAGGSSLSYDTDTNQYIYIWKTDKKWANTCRKLVVLLNDGTYHEAYFTFK